MSQIECRACSHRFRVRSESQSACPNCGSGGPFDIECWRCKRGFVSSELPCITCEHCKEFWTMAGFNRYRPLLTVTEDRA
jgi:hypothetical protein